MNILILLSAALLIGFESGLPLPTIGTYDSWEQSPFRTGALSGNVAIVGNHLADSSSNSSANMLAFQRSRYGSNTFGARIDLAEPFTIHADSSYFAHVMIHKPVKGRVMLIGLGKRANRPEQSPEVEQFWAYTTTDVAPDRWVDAVFPVRCNPGVEIHSLVVVPHCEAPHTLPADFVAYIDEISVSNRPEPRFTAADTPAAAAGRQSTAAEITVSQDNRNGEILMADTGQPVAGQKVPAGRQLIIKLNPSNGFTCGGVIVHRKERRQSDVISAETVNAADSTITLPANLLDADLLLEGIFTELRR